MALLALSASIELVSSSARVTSVKSQQPLGLTDGHPDPTIGPQVYLGPIKIGNFRKRTVRGGGGVPPFSVNFFPLTFRKNLVRGGPGGGGGTPPTESFRAWGF